MIQNPNIVNMDEMEQWLAMQGLAVSIPHGLPYADRACDWMKRKLRRCLLHDQCGFPGLIGAIDPEAYVGRLPLWAEQALREGRPVHEFRYTTAIHLRGPFGEALVHVRDWFRSLNQNLESDNPALRRDADWHLSKLMHWDFREVTERANRWFERQQRHIEEELAEQGTEVLRRLPRGWRWVRLTSPAALDREGKLMGHCVGGGAYDADLLAKRVEIYSLRDAGDVPHITVEVRRTPVPASHEAFGFDRHVTQIHGKKNSTPHRRFWARIAVLLNLLRLPVKDGQIHRLWHCTERLRGGRYVRIATLAEHWRTFGDIEARLIPERRIGLLLRKGRPLLLVCFERVGASGDLRLFDHAGSSVWGTKSVPAATLAALLNEVVKSDRVHNAQSFEHHGLFYAAEGFGTLEQLGRPLYVSRDGTTFYVLNASQHVPLAPSLVYVMLPSGPAMVCTIRDGSSGTSILAEVSTLVAAQIGEAFIEFIKNSNLHPANIVVERDLHLFEIYYQDGRLGSLEEVGRSLGQYGWYHAYQWQHSVLVVGHDERAVLSLRNGKVAAVGSMKPMTAALVQAIRACIVAHRFPIDESIHSLGIVDIRGAGGRRYFDTNQAIADCKNDAVVREVATQISPDLLGIQPLSPQSQARIYRAFAGEAKTIKLGPVILSQGRSYFPIDLPYALFDIARKGLLSTAHTAKVAILADTIVERVEQATREGHRATGDRHAQYALSIIEAWRKPDLHLAARLGIRRAERWRKKVEAARK